VTVSTEGDHQRNARLGSVARHIDRNVTGGGRQHFDVEVFAHLVRHCRALRVG
jgi:hypothetical protein